MQGVHGNTELVIQGSLPSAGFPTGCSQSIFQVCVYSVSSSLGVQGQGLQFL